MELDQVWILMLKFYMAIQVLRKGHALPSLCQLQICLELRTRSPDPDDE